MQCAKHEAPALGQLPGQALLVLRFQGAFPLTKLSLRSAPAICLGQGQNPRICAFNLANLQFVALGVHLGAGATTVTSTGRVGLKLEQTHEHKSHNPYCRFYGRNPNDACHQWRHVVEVRLSGASSRLGKQQSRANHGGIGTGRGRITKILSL